MKICKTNYKINSKEDYRYTLIADFHGDFNLKIAKYIRDNSNEYIIIAGDILNGYNWNKIKQVNKFKKFLNIIKENHKVIISLGNHDLWGIKDIGFKNFKDLKEDNVYPIYNETVIVDNNSFTSFVPDKDCYNYFKQERKETIDKVIKQFNNIEIPSEKYIRHLVSHNPIHFYHKEMIELVKDFDIIETGHLHDGWTPTKYIVKHYDKVLDKGFHEIFNNVILRRNPYKQTVKPKRILSRGIIYMYKDGYHILLPNNKVYYFDRDNNKYSLDSNIKKAPAMIVTGAINTFMKLRMFYPYITNFTITKNNINNSDYSIEKVNN